MSGLGFCFVNQDILNLVNRLPPELQKELVETSRNNVPSVRKGEEVSVGAGGGKRVVGVQMWEGKRSLNLRRHSDSSLPGYRRRIDHHFSQDDSRIPPLHDVPRTSDDDEDENWLMKIANINEQLSPPFSDDLSRFPLLTNDGPPRDKTLWQLRLGLDKLRRRGSVTITEADPSYKVAYLGNVLTSWAKGDGCVDKPLGTLWKNYTTSSKPDVQMKLTVTQSGLKAWTKDHGLTEYWSHRITHCAAPPNMPRVFCWVYRHEGRKLKQELRCHAVLCGKASTARRMASTLRIRLAQALSEFKRDKLLKQNARLSLANSVYDNPSLPRRKILLSTGSHNYRPPLERSKSAPKLMAIEETLEEDIESSPKPIIDQPAEVTSRNNRKVDIKLTNINFVKKLCSSIENLVESTSKRLGERRCSKEFLPPRRPEESILKKPEVEAPERRPRKSVTFQGAVDEELEEEEEDDDESTSEKENVECTEFKLKEQEEESDESCTSLQSISSGGSEDREESCLQAFLKTYDVDLESLSDDEEDVVSDESGFVELDNAVQRLGLDSKEKDTPFHRIIKQAILRPRPLESSCLHV